MMMSMMKMMMTITNLYNCWHMPGNSSCMMEASLGISPTVDDRQSFHFRVIKTMMMAMMMLLVRFTGNVLNPELRNLALRVQLRWQ